MPVDDACHRAQLQLEALIAQIRLKGVSSREALSQMCRDAGMDNVQVAALEVQPLARVALYDELIVGRVVRALQAMLPVCSERFDSDFVQAARSFARAHDHGSIHLRELAEPFARWVAGQWQTANSPGLPGAELARYEALRIEVAAAAEGWAAPNDPRPETGQFSLPRASALMQTPCPVHQWVEAGVCSLSEAEPQPAAEGRYYLLLYRPRDSEVRCLQLSAYAFALLEALGERQLPFASAMIEACAQCDTVPTESLLGQVAALLEQLICVEALCWNDSAVPSNRTGLNQPATR